MKPSSTSRGSTAEPEKKPSSRRTPSPAGRRSAARIGTAPDTADDPSCPYDPNDATSVAGFWNDAVVVRGGIEAVREALAAKRRPGQRGPGRKPAKEAINIRLSPEVLAAFRATGAGWQTRIDGALKDWLARHPECA